MSQNPKHFPFAELVGRSALAMYPDTRAVLTIIVRPTGAVVLGGPVPGANEFQARQGLAYGLRQALTELDRPADGKPLIFMPGGKA